MDDPVLGAHVDVPLRDLLAPEDLAPNLVRQIGIRERLGAITRAGGLVGCALRDAGGVPRLALALGLAAPQKRLQPIERHMASPLALLRIEEVGTRGASGHAGGNGRAGRRDRRRPWSGCRPRTGRPPR